ncbi:quaternary ammonium compound-resistance protein SugE [Ralstonia sp. 25mfcol4.1]|uniref:DMT family transporter n=1 Tax=Ralstonia sp. 25mfcol4.1 TaxID=1761899 RepID=UPI000883A159|nr:multidrug efflux SMR transporter [Ralstonia sp. 25mfcol4.1]SDO91847.1 quaternary ammonium compound-resistance protein SugE [Ralstonia sp. 25mfcol4.1]
MAWTLLVVAGLIEIVMALALKHTDGWTRPVPTLLGIGAALASIYLLSAALRQLPVGTAYAVWTGIGAIGVTLVGILFLGESASPARLALIALIFVGIGGLKLLPA